MDSAAGLLALADIYQAVGNDFHTMHLNFRGAEFDVFHKDVLQEYYEQLGKDADALYERALCFLDTVPSVNDAAKRVDFQSFEGPVDREGAVERADVLLKNIIEQTHIMYGVTDELGQTCPINCGINNWLQDRLDFWSKEYAYFNRKRRGII
jgi:DNA-binding ferritin-like protein